MTTSIETIKKGAPLAPLFPVGTILWRPVQFHARAGALLEHFPFEKTDQDSFILRVRLTSSNFLWEPELMQNRVEESARATFGLVFVDKQPPKRRD